MSLHVPPQGTTGASTVCCLVASSVELEMPTLVFKWKDGLFCFLFQ
jgi:hypothetical protein